MKLSSDPITTEVLAQACALFDRCVDLDPAARNVLLGDLRPDADVAQLLHGMLAADRQEKDPFATPVAEWAAQLESAPATLDGLIGQSIGGFRIVSHLGEGGSSVVFAAERDVAGVAQQVALKLLRTGLYSVEAQRRFRREQSILAQLTHPHIARLIDAGVSAAGIPFIAMERVDGRTLIEEARARALVPFARLRLLAEVARAVDAAHRALIVHRDLKPANILVDREGRVKVLDFGIARLIDDHEPTQTRQIALTPGYAAPEQYRPGAPTTAVDVFALGVIAAELLIDARPGPDARLPAGTDGDGPRKRWQALDGDLATILRTALAEDPSRRYASSRELADDIDRYLAREPISAHPPSRGYRMRKFVSRHRLGLAVGAAMLVTLLLAFLMVLAQRDLARQQAARADSLRDFMFNAFAEAEPGDAREGPATVLDVVRRAIADSDADPDADPGARLELRLRLAQVLQRQGDLEGARVMLEAVRDDALAQWGRASPLYIEAAMYLVQNSLARGAYVLARTQLDGLPPTDDPTQRVERLSLSAMLATRVRDLGRAVADGEAAMAMARRVGDAELLRTTLNDWAAVLLTADRVDDAVIAYQELVSLNRARFGERHVKVSNVQASLARAYRRSGDLDRAEAAARAAVEIDRTVYPGDDRHAAVNLNALMQVLRERGDLDGALAAGREALRINVAVLGEGHPETALARYGVGDILILREEYAAAALLLAQVVDDYTRDFGPAHWRTAAARAPQGYALGMAGSMDAGVAALEQAIDDLRALPDGDLPRLCSAIQSRARLAQHAAEFEAALLWLDRLQAAAPAAVPPSACWSGNVELRRAAVQLDATRHDDATAALTRARSVIDRNRSPLPLMAAELAVLDALILRRSADPGAAAAAQRAEGLLAELKVKPVALGHRIAELRETDANGVQSRR